MRLLSLVALFLVGSADTWASFMDIEVPATTPAKLRTYREMKDGKISRDVLVGFLVIPGGSRVSVAFDNPLNGQYILSDAGVIVRASMPYFETRVLSLPEDFAIEPDVREKVMNTTFYVHIKDIDPPRLISALYPSPLPGGAEKNPFLFPWEAYNPNGTWSHAVNEALNEKTNEFLVKSPPRDVVDFCPRYHSLPEPERRNFWIAFMSEVTWWESAFIPLTATEEGRYDPSNRGITSSGLMQVSLKSSQQSCYQDRGCNVIGGQSDLFHPEKNLHCAIGIMSCLAQSWSCISCKQKSGWKGMAAYWSTLRTSYTVRCKTCPGGKVTLGRKTQIKDRLKTSAAFCQ